MTRSWMPITLCCAALSLLVACAVGGALAEALFAVVAVAFAPLLMLLGATGGRGRSGVAVGSIVLLLVLLEAALALMWLYRGAVDGGPWLLGLPIATAVQIYGLLLLPQLVVVLGFALAFRQFDVEPTELDALRALAPPDGR